MEETWEEDQRVLAPATMPAWMVTQTEPGGIRRAKAKQQIPATEVEAGIWKTMVEPEDKSGASGKKESE